METRVKIGQTEVTANSLFYGSRVTWCSTRTHTLTSCPLTWYFRQIFVDNIFSCFFNHALPKSEVRPVSPDFRVEANRLKKRRRATNVSHSVGSRYPFCHTHLPKGPFSTSTFHILRSLLLCPEERDSRCLWIFGDYLPDYVLQHLKIYRYS